MELFGGNMTWECVSDGICKNCCWKIYENEKIGGVLWMREIDKERTYRNGSRMIYTCGKKGIKQMRVVYNTVTATISLVFLFSQFGYK